MALGWRILSKGEYRVKQPALSADEEEFVSGMASRFKEHIRISEFRGEAEITEMLHSILLAMVKDEGISLDQNQKKYLVEAAFRHIYGLAFFDELLNDPEIEEIAVIGLSKPVYVFIAGKGWKTVNAEITDEHTLMEIINKMAKGIGRRITLQHPRLDASLHDGSRLHASISPVSAGELTIRKFKTTPLSPRQLIDNRTGSAPIFALLSMFMQSDSSIIVSGNTAGGKTTTLNSLFTFIPKDERILITEETPEISIPHEHQIRTVANRDMGISLMDLIYDSLRMRPDRIIVGEVRNREEVNALVDVLLGGQARGVYATFHAQSSQEALNRLESMGVQQMDLSSIDLIAVQRRMMAYDRKARKTREVRKISELSLVENGAPVALARYDMRTDAWKIENTGKALALLAERMGFSSQEAEKEMKFRERLVERAPADFMGFYAAIQKELYGEAK
jgi:Flp pilus assembly CpaF family ATPase